jgi:predicted nucleotidyltransferase
MPCSLMYTSVMDELIKTLKDVFSSDKNVRFAYLFGSIAAKKDTPMSDVDVAVYFDKRIDAFTYRLKLIERLARILNNEKIDIVVLNNASPLLRYEVINNGILLKDNINKRVVYETLVLQEYLDTDHLRKIQMKYIKEKTEAGSYFG